MLKRLIAAAALAAIMLVTVPGPAQAAHCVVVDQIGLKACFG